MTTQILTIDWERQTAVLINQSTSTVTPPTVELSLHNGGNTVIGSNMKYLAQFMTTVLLALAAVTDSAGNALALDALGPLTWASSDESIATVSVNEAGQAVVTPTGKAGTVQISVTGDSDPDTPEFFAGSVTITYLPGEASNVTLQIVDNPAVTAA